MTKKKQTTKKKALADTLWWDFQTRLPPKEFLERITPMILDPIDNMVEMEGDMYMSDYRKFMTVSWKLRNMDSK
jgi:hypothetical protein